MADETREEANKKAIKEKAIQVQEETIARAREARAARTITEEDIGVVKIEIRMPGGLVSRPLVPRSGGADPGGDGTDPNVFDGNPTDRDNRVGDSDADTASDFMPDQPIILPE